MNKSSSWFESNTRLIGYSSQFGSSPSGVTTQPVSYCISRFNGVKENPKTLIWKKYLGIIRFKLDMLVPIGEMLLVQFKPRGRKTSAMNREEQPPILPLFFPLSSASDD